MSTAVQRIAAELRPNILDKLGLVTALRYEAKRFEQRSGTRCALFAPDEQPNMSPEVATGFFRIFQEALTNVARHSSASDVEATFRIQDGHCVLEVRDNGKGIDSNALLSPRSLGLLGMQERARQMGGRLLSGRALCRHCNTIERPHQHMRNSAIITRLLIADDHAVVRQGLAEILRQALGNATVTEAADTRQAIQQLLEQEFDVVLLDINMPGRGGLEVLQEARRICPRTPVLVLSAYSEEEFAFRAFKSGAAGYLNKQTSSDELVLAVKKLLAGGKYVTAAWAEKLVATMGGDLHQTPHEALSVRELQVLRLVALGKTLKEVADELCLSEKTVGVYRTRLSKKMGLSTNVELARYALKNGLVD
jgi:DNA-binding NarL/FixJ family response regulator